MRPTSRSATGLRAGMATIIAGHSGKMAPAANLNMNRRTSGFTLIELMIALAIFAFLVFLAGPIYADFMGNSKIRNAAENTLTGIRLAQSNAIRNNR
ncbi:MAG: type II secretion system protein, partial [Betaproteobacteria bacterium]